MFWYSHLGNPPQISLTVVITTLKPRPFFSRRVRRRGTELFEGVAFKRENPHLDIGA